MALQVHALHGIPFVLGEVRQRTVAQDPGVVDEHVQGAERLDREGHDLPGLRPARDVMAADHGAPAGLLDLVRDLPGGRRDPLPRR